jgi:hypothetical protein
LPGANYPAVRPAGVAVAIKPRVAQHGKVLGVMWLVYSVLHLLPGLFLIAFFHGMRDLLPADVPDFVPGILQMVGLGLSAVSILGVIAGWGILSWKPWARMLTIVLGILHLINIPLGTGLGVYTLWVLLPAESEVEYRQQAELAASYS